MKRLIVLAVALALPLLMLVSPFSLPAYADGIEPSGTLPVIYIETENGRTVNSKTKYINASMRIETGKGGEYPHSLYAEKEGGISIRARGNSTYWQDKKPYKIKLDTADDLLGMGVSRHWILLANVYDRSFLRNELAYAFSAELGMTYIKTRHVELVLNGDYKGLYQLTESIRIEKDRIDIRNWKKTAKEIASKLTDDPEAADLLAEEMETDLSWVDTRYFTDGGGKTFDLSEYIDDLDITGGYLFELDEYYDKNSKFTTAHNMPVMIDTPENAYTSDSMMEWCEDYFRHAENAMISADFHDRETGKHYSEFIDVDSFVDYWIVNQAFKNVEILWKSCFMYMDCGGKLTFGPVWDMDWSSGNHVNLSDTSAALDQWRIGDGGEREYWYRSLYDDPWFVQKIKDRWFEVRGILQRYIDSIDSLCGRLSEAAALDRLRWGDHHMSFEDECGALRDWLDARAEWMDVQLSKRDPNIDGKGIEKDRALILALKDENGADAEADASECGADYLISSGSVVLEISVKHDLVKRWQILVNGRTEVIVPSEGAAASITLDSSRLFDENGFGILMVLGKNDGETVYGAGYISVRASDGLAAEIDAVSDDSDVQMESVLSAVKLTVIASAAAVSAISAAVLIVRKVVKKR
ncbi:MAG: CotH kinase family protein [Clostridiales bacterium]|nr:CotH kinase family protein [Clostridiales bacterium]